MANRKFDYPKQEHLKKIDRKLTRVRGSLVLPKDASPVEALKHQLCSYFVRYFIEHGLTQRDFAKMIDLSEARMSEILHYRHSRFTIDHLIKYLAKIKPDIKIKVA